MKKYDRKDFYVVRLGYINDVNKFNYPGAAQDSLRFLNMYKKNGFFALTLKKDGYFVDLVNGQIFGENTPFCVINKKSLAEFLLGEGKITKREAILEMIYCIPLFATELGVDYVNKTASKKECFNVNIKKHIKYPIEVLEAKLNEIGYQGNYQMVYDTRDIFRKKLNDIPTSKELKLASTKYSINDFYFAVVKEENLQGEINTFDTYISSNYQREYVTLFLKLPDGTLLDLLTNKIATSYNGYLIKSILCQELLANYSSFKGRITKENALEEAKRYADSFLEEYKNGLDADFLKVRINS